MVLQAVVDYSSPNKDAPLKIVCIKGSKGVWFSEREHVIQSVIHGTCQEFVSFMEGYRFYRVSFKRGTIVVALIPLIYIDICTVMYLYPNKRF